MYAKGCLADPLGTGGSHDYWGGPGYERCRARIGPDFEDVFYKNNWASNVKMHSVYMFYGYGHKVYDLPRLEPDQSVAPAEERTGAESHIQAHIQGSSFRSPSTCPFQCAWY